jgi:hypothetical protein
LNIIGNRNEGEIMSNEEKKRILQCLSSKGTYKPYHEALEAMGDIRYNYTEYFENHNADEAIQLLPTADYDLCCAILTLILREDYWINGSFERRYSNGQVTAVVERMLELLQ